MRVRSVERQAKTGSSAWNYDSDGCSRVNEQTRHHLVVHVRDSDQHPAWMTYALNLIDLVFHNTTTIS